MMKVRIFFAFVLAGASVALLAFALSQAPQEIAVALPLATNATSLALPPLPEPAGQAPAIQAKAIWVPILVYHHIGKAPENKTSAYKSFFIESAWFEKHLQYLQENGFTTIHFSDVADYFESGQPLPPRPVIVSFDDGWTNFYANAFPILKKYNMTATSFVISNLVGHSLHMSWDQIKELRDSGMEIGSHTLWHPYLTKSKKAKAEIEDSKKKLEEELGIPITTFAYPFGDYNEQIEKMVADAGYTTARLFSTGNGISQENIFRIPVVRVYANVSLERWKKQLYPDEKWIQENSQ
ncbi:MAG: polysaccharide deacetylase family protein [Patescibacteria group bacterium]